MARVPPRPPRAPSPPPRPRLRGTLRLRPPRQEESVAIDGKQTRQGATLPPFVPWERFIREFEWKRGEHLTTIGPTGSGKTVLNRQLLRLRAQVVVLGVKQRDPELYGPFQKEGYELRRTFDADWIFDDEEPDLILFVPQTTKQRATERRKELGERFRQALADIYQEGYWCVYCDDVSYLASQLGVTPELEELWLLGRSEGVTLVASSQEPVNIPVMAYGMATHLFLFNNPDVYRARRMAELTGVNREIAQETILSLPPHEFLYINKNTKQLLRSKVTRKSA
jgi:hypothetical protein